MTELKFLKKWIKKAL